MDNADAHPGAIPGKNEVTREGVVVVIDDDASIRAALKELFESVGLKVKLYASGSAFLEDPIPNATSCLVLDMRLPEMSGLNVQEELARADVHLPIVFVTGHGDIPMAVRAMKAGLLDAVFTALEQDRTRRETQ
jgi:FixJ family two-component response regulator